MKRPLVIFIAGPTGSGKTEAGLALAGLMPCEFLSADSMQVYKGMDIITDKLPRAIRSKKPYHLLDIVPPFREFNVAAYCRAASRAVSLIVKKKKIPVVVGGTGLYVRSLIHGIFEKGGRSDAAREQLLKTLEKEGSDALHERLARVDPEAAARIHPRDSRRILRALEVYETTQKPISELRKQGKGLAQGYDARVFGLRRSREDLYERIDRRVDDMMASGLLDEVRRLLKTRLSRSASQCIGLKEIQGFFEGRYGLEEAIGLMKRNSRRLAKRQLTWFRAEPGIEWIDVGTDMPAQAIAKVIACRLSEKVPSCT
ncbi:MAG: tRNA (adenosine(37)-N6)-dimethylallyltransferase MiaA [Candidatus Omnitrophota bacterium]